MKFDRCTRGALLALASICMQCAASANAEEGGASVYMPGAYNDFAAGVAGPPGVYLRNDVAIYDLSINARPLGGTVDAGIDQFLVLDLVKFAWIPEGTLLGGAPSVAVIVPVVPHVDVDARVRGPGFGVFRTGGISGFGDVIVLPSINWTKGNHHFTVGAGISMPVGRYSEDRAVNLGRNYWAFDPQVTYTYLDPTSGLDISGTAGVLFNGKNKATNYTSGTSIHFDALVAKHFASGLALGLNGYWYQQVEDDKGNIPPILPEGFRGSAAGIGPAAMMTLKAGRTELNLIGKWLHDVEATNRMKGDTVMISLALKL